MYYIREVANHALTTGYLSLEAEESLRKLLGEQCSEEDLEAFIALQDAAMRGQVRQQSREIPSPI